MLSVTPIYGSLLIGLIVLLAYRVTVFRRSESIALGDEKGSYEMKRAVRAHANAIENIPVALILLLMLELNHVNPWLLHSLGLVLLAARGMHAYGLSKKSGPSVGRFYGTAITWLLLVVMVVLNILVLITR